MVNKDRRKMLVKTGAAITGLTFTGIASANSDAESLDFNFNPEDEAEVFAFVKLFDQIEDIDKQEKTYYELDTNQQKAVFEARKPAEMVVETTREPPMGTVGLHSGYSSTHTVTLRQVTGSVYYRFHHRINWDSSGGSVSDPSSMGWVSHVAFGYNDGGNNDKWIDNSGNTFESYRQRRVVYGVGGTGLSYYPSIHLEGDSSGNATVIEEYDGL